MLWLPWIAKSYRGDDRGDVLFSYLISFSRKPINFPSGPRVLKISGEI